MTDNLAYFSPLPDGVEVVVKIDGQLKRIKWSKGEAIFRAADLMKYISEIKDETV